MRPVPAFVAAVLVALLFPLALLAGYVVVGFGGAGELMRLGEVA